MVKFRFLVICIIVSIALCGCIINPSEITNFRIVNQYQQPISEIQMFEISSEGLVHWFYYGNLNITQGDSQVFELGYFLNPFTVDIKVSFDSEYDVKTTRFTSGRTTTLTLNENGILE